MDQMTAGGMVAVRELIARYDLHRGMLPVPVRQVARDEGWIVQYGEIAPAYGYAVTQGMVRVMVINEAVSPAYQRFAIAHEMAHLLADDPGHVHLCQPNTSGFERWLRSRDEHRASLLAANLLIPTDAIQPDIPVEEIAATCGAPVELVRLRLNAVISLGW